MSDHAEAYADLARCAEAWYDVMWQCAVMSYTLYHRRLPGSDRTSRLRKKRYTKVMDWFEANVIKEEAA